jgi:hypothetical protein
MKRLLLTGTMFLGTILTGCAGGGYYTSARVGPPPPPRYGVMGYAPGSGYVWTDGFWDLRGSRWVWTPGRWQRPPRHGATWVPNQWQSNHGRYQMRRGYWRM